MGLCGSKSEASSSWSVYFDKSFIDCLKTEPIIFKYYETSRTDAEMQVYIRNLQIQFNKLNVSLAKSLFKSYDADKDGYLQVGDLQRMIQDSITVLISNVDGYLNRYIMRSLKQTLTFLEKQIASRGQTLSPDVESMMLERLNIVKREIMDSLNESTSNIMSHTQTYAVDLLHDMQVQSSKVSLQEFESKFLVSYAHVVDPFYFVCSIEGVKEVVGHSAMSPKTTPIAAHDVEVHITDSPRDTDVSKPSPDTVSLSEGSRPDSLDLAYSDPDEDALKPPVSPTSTGKSKARVVTSKGRGGARAAGRARSGSTSSVGDDKPNPEKPNGDRSSGDKPEKDRSLSDKAAGVKKPRVTKQVVKPKKKEVTMTSSNSSIEA